MSSGILKKSFCSHGDKNRRTCVVINVCFNTVCRTRKRHRHNGNPCNQLNQYGGHGKLVVQDNLKLKYN